MWRRVSCEQPLNTSQSILRLRGSLDQTRGVSTLFFEWATVTPKGNPVHIPEPGRGTDSDPRLKARPNLTFLKRIQIMLSRIISRFTSDFKSELSEITWSGPSWVCVRVWSSSAGTWACTSRRTAGWKEFQQVNLISLVFTGLRCFIYLQLEQNLDTAGTKYNLG